MSSVKEQSKVLDGYAFGELIRSSTRGLALNVDLINALNVFPVPDGDTGTNMLLTMQAAEKSLDKIAKDSSVHQVAEAISSGTLLGARGNSGVILSQWFQGLAEGLANCAVVNSQNLCKATVAASRSSYSAVGSPVEGTMLTIFKVFSEAINKAESKAANLADLWEAGYQAANLALAETPNQLAILKEAGVVDAGGQGFICMLLGAQAYLSKTDIPDLPSAPQLEPNGKLISEDFVAEAEHSDYGYCTQLLISGDDLVIDSIRDYMLQSAQSSVVIGSTKQVRVHVHTEDPGSILSYAITLGSLDQISVENMDQQRDEFLQKTPSISTSISNSSLSEIITIAIGEGIHELFRSVGASDVIEGGSTMNPSVEQIVTSINQASADNIFILPNHKNIVAASKQAASLVKKQVIIVESLSVPQGLAAMLSFNPDCDIATNTTNMTASLNNVTSASITKAVRNAKLKEAQILEGEFLGLLEDKPISTNQNIEPVLAELLGAVQIQDGALVTLYRGQQMDNTTCETILSSIQNSYPNVDFEIIAGGDPNYHLFIGIE